MQAWLHAPLCRSHSCETRLQWMGIHQRGVQSEGGAADGGR